MIPARDLDEGTMYMLADASRIRFSSPAYLERLLARPHLLLEKEPTPENSFHLVFQTDHLGEFPTFNPRLYVFEDQNFIGPQKTLANTYRNKGKEFLVRDIFHKKGMTGYNPAANLIFKGATGVKYTPNPYQTGGKRKTMKRKSKKKAKSRRHRS